MNIAQQIITNINESILIEKASIDWNNYLTPEEVKQFLSKDDKVESAEEIVYSTKGNFYNKYFQDFKKEGWTKRELTQDLANFYFQGHLTENNTEVINYGPYKAADGTWVIDLKPGYITQYGTNYIQCKTRKECLDELNYVSKEELNESVDNLWKSQIDNKDREDLENYIIRLYRQLENYEEVDIKSNKYYELLDKIEYIEAKLGNKPKIGRELH